MLVLMMTMVRDAGWHRWLQARTHHCRSFSQVLV